MSNDFSSFLGRGEIVRWTGQPQQGMVFRPIDLLLIPFSLLWCGFAIFWEASVLSSGASAFMAIWGIPFVGVGLYFVAGRFFVDALLRSRTRYALTDHRALILGGINGGRLTEIDLRSTSEIRYQTTTGSRGTISFGADPGPFRGDPWHSIARARPEFFRAENAAAAYRIIQAAKSPKA